MVDDPKALGENDEGEGDSAATPDSAGIQPDGEPAPDTATGLLRVPDSVLMQHVADEIVFLNLESGTYFGLDPIGSRMMDILLEEDDLDTVVARLEEEYETTADVLHRDVRFLIDQLVNEGLITRVAGDSPSDDDGAGDRAPDAS